MLHGRSYADKEHQDRALQETESAQDRNLGEHIRHDAQVHRALTTIDGGFFDDFTRPIDAANAGRILPGWPDRLRGQYGES